MKKILFKKTSIIVFGFLTMLSIIFIAFNSFNINANTFTNLSKGKNSDEIDKLEAIDYTMGGTYGYFSFNALSNGDDSGKVVEDYNVLLRNDVWFDSYGEADVLNTTGRHSLIVSKDKIMDRSFSLGKEYKNDFVVGIGDNWEGKGFHSKPYSPKAVSEDYDINKLEKPTYEISDKDVTITTNVKTFLSDDQLPDEPFHITDYMLELVDNGGASIAKTGILDTYGDQDIEVNDLGWSYDYEGAKVIAKTSDGETTIATSPEFDLVAKNHPKTISDPEVTELNKDSILVKTTIKGNGDTVEDLAPYTLELRNSNEEIISSSTESFTDGGEKEIEFDDLRSGKDYSDSILAVVDGDDHTTLIESNTFGFTTPKKQVDTLLKIKDEFYVDRFAFTTHISDSTGLIDSGSNDNYEGYTLELHDANDEIVGNKSELFETGGDKKMFIDKELDPAKIYSNYTIVAKNEEGVVITASDKFDINTPKYKVFSLNEPTTSEITKDSLTITTNVLSDWEKDDSQNKASKDYGDDYVEDYYLEVLNNDDQSSLGKTNILTTDGDEEITLEGLEFETHYNIVVKAKDINDNILATSPKISFSTSKASVNSLTDASVNKDTTEYDSAEFTVDAESMDSSSSTNNSLPGHNLNEYKLEVTNDEGNVLGETSSYTTSGVDTFVLDTLTAETTYSNYYIQVVGNPEIRSEVLDDFETPLPPFIFKQDTFKVVNVTKKTFDFTVDFNMGTSEEDFPTETLHLYSGDDEFKIICNGQEQVDASSNGDITKRISYTAKNLKSNHSYENIMISIGKKGEKISITDSSGNLISIKTKINWLIISIISLSTISLLLLIMIIILIVYKSVRKKNEYCELNDNHHNIGSWRGLWNSFSKKSKENKSLAFSGSSVSKTKSFKQSKPFKEPKLLKELKQPKQPKQPKPLKELKQPKHKKIKGGKDDTLFDEVKWG